MTTSTQAVAKRDKSDALVSWMRRQQDDIAMAAASHVKPSAIIRVTQGALRRDPKLLAAALANPQSLLACLLDCARLGHEPDTDEYYLVPFGNEVTGIEGYKGIVERMFRAGGVTSVVAQVVRQHDRYVSRGQDTPPVHEYDDFASPQARGPLRGAYAYALFPGGGCSQVIRMGRDEIMAHKAKSRGAAKADSPWKQWEEAMWKKTVLRALEPYVPTSAEYRFANGMARADSMAGGQRDAFTYLPPPGSLHSGRAEEIIDAEVVDDPDSQEVAQPPARATSGQLSMLGQRLAKLSIEDERRHGTLEKLAERDLTEEAPLTQDEATRIRGLLDRCIENGGHGALVELLATGQLPETAKAGDSDG